MGQFDRQIETALRLIKKNGQQIVWRKTKPIVPDVDKPWLPTGDVEIEYTPFVCFLPLNRVGKEFIQSLGQSEAVSGTYYGLMGAQPFAPNLTDVVVRDGVELDINSIDILSPNGQIILYTVTING